MSGLKNRIAKNAAIFLQVSLKCQGVLSVYFCCRGAAKNRERRFHQLDNRRSWYFEELQSSCSQTANLFVPVAVSFLTTERDFSRPGQ